MIIDWDLVKKLFEFVGAIIIIVGAVYGTTKFIDNRIQKQIYDESFLRKLAKIIKPTVIFNDASSIIVDQGAMEYIQTIDVKLSDKKIPLEIIVRPKKYLAIAPILTLLDNELAELISERGKHYDWCFRLNYTMHYTDFTGRRFRLELFL